LVNIAHILQTQRPPDFSTIFIHHGLVLDQAAASDAKLNAMPAACPVPTALFEESGTGQASAPQNPDDIARHEAGEEGF
jgi:hypothetical protein